MEVTEQNELASRLSRAQWLGKQNEVEYLRDLIAKRHGEAALDRIEQLVKTGGFNERLSDR